MAPREASSAARFARAAALAAAVGVASAQTWVAPNSNYPKGCVPNPFPSAGGYVSNPNAVGTFYADGSFDTNLVNTSNVRWVPVLTLPAARAAARPPVRGRGSAAVRRRAPHWPGPGPVHARVGRASRRRRGCADARVRCFAVGVGRWGG